MFAKLKQKTLEDSKPKPTAQKTEEKLGNEREEIVNTVKAVDRH